MTILDFILFLIFCWSLFNLYKTKNNVLPIKIEQVILLDVQKESNQIYIWNSISGEFIAQGSSLEEAIDKGKIRFPGVILKVKEDEITTG